MSVKVQFETVEQFNDFIVAMNEKYGIPNEQTEKYTDLINVNGQLIAFVKEADLDGLTLSDVALPLPDLLI